MSGDVARPLTTFLRRTFVDQVPRDHRDSPRVFLRRRIVALVTVVIGSVVLAWSLRIAPGAHSFYPATLLLAAVWIVGAFASGPLHLGRILRHTRAERPVLEPALVAAALVAVFAVGGAVARQVPFARHQVAHVLDHSAQGSLPLIVIVTAINGIAEELFFRGAVYAAIERSPAIVTTAIYTVVTLASGNLMLAFAGLVLGIVVALERRASGGILAPMITHVVWSVAMLFVLPALF